MRSGFQAGSYVRLIYFFCPSKCRRRKQHHSRCPEREREKMLKEKDGESDPEDWVVLSAPKCR